MNYKIVKMDARYTGYHYFKYRLEFRSSLIRDSVGRFHCYQELRDWLWENYGASCERDLYRIVFFSNRNEDTDSPARLPKWAWHYDTTDNQPFLYVADDATLAHLQLKWST